MQTNMEFKFQKRRGLGTVIATLIILIASVILGAGVIFFGGSMFQTNTQSESVKVSNVHTWVSGTNSTSTTAFAVQNVGSKAVTISSIQMRGLSVPSADWFYCITCATATNIQTELPADYSEASVTIGGAATVMTTPGPVSLNQGQAAIIYIHEAGNIDNIDSGLTLTLQIQAGQASAVQSVNVVTV